MSDRLTEAVYIYFSAGDFFEAEGFEERTTPAERDALWAKHREAILARHNDEMRQRGPSWAGRRPQFFWRDLQVAGHRRRQVGVAEWWGPWEPGGAKLHHTPIVESDLAFLTRVAPDALAAWEREADAAAEQRGRSVMPDADGRAFIEWPGDCDPEIVVDDE
jgi:hypothetical protein